MKKILLLGIVIVFVSNNIVFSQNPDDFLPEENEIPGWVFDIDSLCKEGTADDSTDLYAIIDGGAELYNNLGFVAGAFDGYTDGSHHICIEIYDQNSKSNAALVYQATHDGLYKPISSVGDSTRLDTSLVFNFEIEMIVDKFFVRIYSKDTKEDAYIQAATSMAQNIACEVGIIENPNTHNISSTNYINVSYTKNTYLFIIRWKNKAQGAFIYNNKGQLIRDLTLYPLENGYKTFWDGKNTAGQHVAKGRYTIIVRSDERLISKSFIKNK